MCNRFNIVLVVLVYRNTQDIKDFFSFNKQPNCKVIVVNSYYDDSTEREFERIAIDNNADFISVPNKGYGAGNNRGIEYALSHYIFDYLIISNADVIIEKLDIQILRKYDDCIIAPEIINCKNKRQNPSMPFKPTIFLENIKRWLCVGNHFKLIWLYFAYSRLMKIIYYCIYPFKKNIFSAHGSFVIIPQKVLERLIPLYNENMFLFNEEEYLGRKANESGILTYYERGIRIFHKEDGSMKIASVNEMERLRQSYIVYYDYWFRKSGKRSNQGW